MFKNMYAFYKSVGHEEGETAALFASHPISKERYQKAKGTALYLKEHYTDFKECKKYESAAQRLFGRRK
jgi:hypothetical protein